MGFGIGQPVRRIEDARFITGRGRYVDDIKLAGQAYAAVVMSPHAHALITRIDVAAARAVPGCLCILTGHDLAAQGIGLFPPLFMPEDAGGPPGYRTLRPALCTDRVRCVSDRVAFVVGDTLAAAREAADLVEVEYAPLPALVDVAAATRPGAPALWPDCPDNVSVTLQFGDKEATDAAFAAAHTRVSLRLVNNRVSANPMEPRAANGLYDPSEETYTLYTTSQNPHGVRHMLTQSLLHISETKLRVVAPDVGGGFGMKADPYPEDLLVLIGAKRCGRPVKYVATRSESLQADTHGRDQLVTGDMALDAEGRILAIRADSSHAVGAYTVGAAMAQPNFASRLITNVYDVQTVDITARAVFTSTAPLGVYRGAGRPEATYLVERLLDRAAAALGLDPAEIRRRNFIHPGQMPYATPGHFTYDSGEFEAILDHCLKAADWHGFEARRIASEKHGRRRGRAVTCYIETAGIFNDAMSLRFDPGGGVTIVAGTHSHGQGHATVFTQLVAEWLGLPFEKVGFLQGDTAAVPFGRGTYAARSAMIGGSALKVAADKAIARIGEMAAFLLHGDAADIFFEEGLFKVRNTNRVIPLTEAVKVFFAPGGIPASFGVGLETSGTWNADLPNFPNGCHVGEVEVDPATGIVRIDRYFVVDDTGRALNPMICEGQILGGLAQGIGQALMEGIVYDAQGQLLTGSFTDYCMPRTDDFPDFTLMFHDIPCKTNPLGVKGVGESGAIAAPPTIINAILHALRPLGVRDLDMPATPSRIWDAIRHAAA